MRAGGYTVHQSLTAEAAAVLKLSLGLARRRGHAQVTPLHVAYTLLGASTASTTPLFATAAAFAASTPAYGLLRRACARSHCHPGGPHPHPAQCRALELCFNVALNRLPTANAVVGSPHSSPSSNSSASSTSFAASLLHQPNPTLSNALVAALKRAQANQRRGCVELQTQPSPPSTTTTSTSPAQQQQPMITIKVELDQLIISILDDPSVSRVMREAGLSSAAVKTNLEEESAAMVLGLGHHNGSSAPPPSSSVDPAAAVQPQFFLPALATSGDGALWPWPAPFFSHQQAQGPDVEFESSPCKAEAEDVRAILEVMSRHQEGGRGRRRTNPVVVGDSVSVAEASVAELMRRMERGDVPDDLRGARVLRLHLSHVHVRLMTRADVDAWAVDLRRSVIAATNTAGAGLVIYLGDMLWAVDSDDDAGAQAASGFSPAAHLAAELARLLGELRAASRGGRTWLVAAASYGTYMRCQRSSLDLESTWALQPVAVPAGGGLGLQLGPRAASPAADGKVAQFPLLHSAPKEQDAMPTLCADCAKNYESEASAVRAKVDGTNFALTFFPGWPQADEPQTSHKDDLMELKRKWSRLCLRVHSQWNQSARPTNATTSSANPALCLGFETPIFQGTNKIKHQNVKTTLSLLLRDSVEASESEDMDAKLTVQELDAGARKSSDMKRVPCSWTNELPCGLLKRKAEDVWLPSESKRWKGSGGLDLNLCPHEDDDGGSVSSEDDLVPSDLTNDDGEASGDAVTGSLGSHC
ncbi:hypothetical protein BS78_04G127200 [Paspalum vaginatum]|nr:hypothetical protein BS78_04G127200 [Paspalum vaginatum]